MSIHEPRSARAAQLELPSVWRASSASILSNRGKQCKRCKQRNHCGQASSASSANKASSISTGGKQCKQGGCKAQCRHTLVQQSLASLLNHSACTATHRAAHPRGTSKVWVGDAVWGRRGCLLVVCGVATAPVAAAVALGS
eukprot:scaffold128976_cov25-Tisochrysis_lutea.AAC.1